jgi:hypothetical protein
VTTIENELPALEVAVIGVTRKADRRVVVAWAAVGNGWTLPTLSVATL